MKNKLKHYGILNDEEVKNFILETLQNESGINVNREHFATNNM
jgi:acetylornithine/succinyldiaminopimelate/putrescine aminotransferase